MRPIQLFLISLFGGLTIYLEFQNIKQWTLFGAELFDFIPLILLCILTVVYLIKNVNQYQVSRNFILLIPSLTGLLFLALTFGHKFIRSHLDNSQTLFTAVNYDIGNDGGFTLDFKTNNHLKGVRVDHFSETYYWGSYAKHGDTLELDIQLDFKMGKHALLQKDTLRFMDDTIHFSVYKP
jgi:hypothetical protein